VARATIQQQGENRLLVELPTNTDIEATKRLLTTMGFLEFREVELKDGKPVYLNDYLESTVNDFFDKKETGKRLFVNEGGEAKEYGKPIAFLVKDEKGLSFTDINGNPIDRETLKQGLVQVPAWILARDDDGTPLTGAYLSDASPDIQQGVTGGQPEVNIKWDAEGSIIFDQIAKRLYNPQEAYSLEHVLGIFLDNALISAPQIRAQVFHGTGVISGSFTVDSATELANLLKSSALPVPVTIVELNTFE
jgi:preprotein translocase subunit SecD